MNLQHLRAATRSEHEATEAAMPLLDPGLQLDRYVQILRLLAPVLASWEAWSAVHVPARLAPLLPPRRRSAWLEADLSILTGEPISGADAAALPWPAAILPPGETLEGAAPGAIEAGFLGALYVLEGSTLGGRILAKRVESSLNLVPGQGNAYFTGHGEATAALWREILAEIGAIPERDGERLIRAATQTFQIFRGALQLSVESGSPGQGKEGKESARDKQSKAATAEIAAAALTSSRDGASNLP